MKNPLLYLILLIYQPTAPILAAEKLTLASFLKQVQEQSPDYQIETTNKEMAQLKAQGIKLADPMLGFMNMKESGSSQSGIEISQELSFPTKITAEKNSREAESKADSLASTFRQKELLISAKMAFLSYWSSYQKNETLAEKKIWIKEHLKLARAIAKADSTSQLHLLEIESELDAIESELVAAESELTQKYLSLKIFSPNMTEAMQVPLLPELTSLQIDSIADNNLIKTKEAELQSSEAFYSYKKQSYFPDLIFRFRSYQGNEMQPKNEELMVGLTLPFVFFWQPKNEAKEASLKVLKAQAELKKAQIEADSRIHILVEKSKSAKKQWQLLKDKLIPRAHKRMKLVENISVRSMEGLNEHRNVMLNYLDLKLKEIDLRTEYESNIAELQKMGVEVGGE